MRIVVLDTNILVMILSSKSHYHHVFQQFLRGDFEIAVSNEILFEYEEILAKKFGHTTAHLLLSAINVLPNVVFVTPFYQWNLITNDPDDNKFVDCAILANAQFLITEDKHFNILKRTPFPKVNLLNLDDLSY